MSKNKWENCIGECCPCGIPKPENPGMICHTHDPHKPAPPLQTLGMKWSDDQSTSFTVPLLKTYDCKNECMRPRSEAKCGYIYRQEYYPKNAQQDSICICDYWPNEPKNPHPESHKCEKALEENQTCFKNTRLTPKETCKKVLLDYPDTFQEYDLITAAPYERLMAKCTLQRLS